MHIGGRWGARPAVAAVRRGACRLTRAPAFGVAAIAPLVFASAVGGAAPVFPGRTAPVHAVITPVAAVAASGIDLSGPVVIAMKRPPTSFRVAVATISAPPPPMIVNSPGALGIPAMALSAYRNAELKMAAAAPGCGVSWNLLAGIGRIESMHANGGATDARGTAIQPIYGPTLDGTLPGNEIIIQSSVGNRVTYARAMGPMQFLPGTWARYATDGDDDGVADPQNLFDSTLAAARYLCSGGLNLRDPAQVMAALLRYNNSMPYAQNVLGWAAGYATDGDDDGVADPQNLFDSTLAAAATCVAVGSTCATRRRSWPRSCATTTRCLTPRTCPRCRTADRHLARRGCWRCRQPRRQLTGAPTAPEWAR